MEFHKVVNIIHFSFIFFPIQQRTVEFFIIIFEKSRSHFLYNYFFVGLFVTMLLLCFILEYKYIGYVIIVNKVARFWCVHLQVATFERKVHMHW